MENLVVLVTGSNRGIGRATIEEFAKEGCNVVINYCHHEEEALEFMEYIGSTYNVDCMAAKCDISDEEEVEKMVNSVVDHFGTIDVLVNNASVCRDSLLLDKTVVNSTNGSGTITAKVQRV
jgi:3-oxoacyl-[acyl-carrier protein] reductase